MAASFSPSQTAPGRFSLFCSASLATHVLFRAGWLLSTSEVTISYTIALLGGIIYRFATAERKSSFFRGAVALFVGKQVATSLEQSADNFGSPASARPSPSFSPISAVLPPFANPKTPRSSSTCSTPI